MKPKEESRAHPDYCRKTYQDLMSDPTLSSLPGIRPQHPY
jgi:hypothetical protein